MRFRHWLAAGISLGFLLGAPGLVMAQDAPAAGQPVAAGDQPAPAAANGAPAAEKPAPKLPKVCVEAGIATAEECTSFIAQQKAEKAAAKDAADKAATEKAAAEKAAAEKAAAEKAAADKAAADKAAADKAAADKAAADKAAADKAAADKAAADKAAADKAAADKAAADKAAADKAAADKTAADKTAADKAAADKAAADKAAAEKAAADKAAADKAAPPATEQPAQPQAKPADGQKAVQANDKPEPSGLPKDCIEAGMKTQAECDALHAINAQTGKAPVDKTAPAATPAPAAGTPPAATAPAAQPGTTPAATAPAAGTTTPPAQPAEVIPNLPKDVTPNEVAPLLDSAKDAESAATAPVPADGKPAKPGQPGRQDRAPRPQVQQPAVEAPPPVSDKAAQSGIIPTKVVPIGEAKGEKIDPNAANAPKVEVPQNVTIINQTVVNNTTNTTTNTTVNNTQNNAGPGVQQNGGQPGTQTGERPGRPGRNGNPPPGSEATANPIGLGLNIIVQLGDQLFINSPARDQRRIANDRDSTTYERLPNDRYRETITRPDGVRIVTIYNRHGDILRRSRFDRNGHEVVLAYFDPSHDEDLLNWRDPGEDLPPLRLTIPARDYVLDADQADERQVQQFFAQPPVEKVTRLYSIDEVKRSARIRDMVRRLEIGDLTFDTGAATISQDQVGNLSKVAQAMLDLLDRNPAETFLIEGHTDAVGSDISNLELSDARAATVARILTDFYHIPPENLATQGYGERYLKVQTPGPERINRRVTIRRITPLVTVANGK